MNRRQVTDGGNRIWPAMAEGDPSGRGKDFTSLRFGGKSFFSKKVTGRVDGGFRHNAPTGCVAEMPEVGPKFLNLAIRLSMIVMTDRAPNMTG